MWCRSMNTYSVASFFSGCGGLDLGLEGGFRIKASSIRNRSYIASQAGDTVTLKKTGLNTVFACDINGKAKLAWERYFNRPHIYHRESVVDLVKKAHDGTFSFPHADVVTGGFPCQDFSVAGKRRGFRSFRSHKNETADDELPSIESRGMLYFWLREAIAIIQPKIFIAENVKGLVSLGDVADVIKRDFSTVNNGYYVLEPRVLNAADYGVPQSRERVFFIGIRSDLLSSMATAGEPYFEQLLSYPEPSHDYASGDYVQLQDYLLDLPEPEYSTDPSHQKYSKAKWYGKHCQGQTEVKLSGVAPTIRSEHHGNIEFRRLSPINGGKNEPHLAQRRLSVRECARIQTFPDDFDFVFPGVSASEAYRMIGNAVPPLLAYHLSHTVKRILDVTAEPIAECA